VPDLHRAITAQPANEKLFTPASPITQRAQKAKVQSMIPIHAKNMHTLIAVKVVLPSRKE
jgi:hypothetical protein